LLHDFRALRVNAEGAGARDKLWRMPKNPTGTPLRAEVFPSWSTPLRAEPQRDATRLADLPRGHVVTVESGGAWLRVSTVVDGRALHGYVSHEQLRGLGEATGVEEPAKPAPTHDARLPPLRGQIAEASALFVRAKPGAAGPILGKLSLQPMEVTVLESREIKTEGPPSKDLWYRVRFSEEDFQQVAFTYAASLLGDRMAGNVDAIARGDAHDKALGAHQGTEAWIGQAAIPTIAMPWPFFLELLAAFDAEHADEPVLRRLSRLRQLGEESDVPANEVVGAGADIANPLNRDKRQPDPKRWQLLYESKQVELPGGEIVDIHHFLLGVESLIDDGRRSEERRITPLDLPVGQSYAAATWSGDVGGAVADFVHHKSETWEKGRIIGRAEDDVLKFYFRTRAPDLDLLGDIDAWGAYELAPSPKDKPRINFNDSLVRLLTSYYGPDTQTPQQQATTVAFGRSRGLRNLLMHYGFTSAAGLEQQTVAVAAMEEQVFIFSKAWYQAKQPSFLGKVQQPSRSAQDDLAAVSHAMTLMFVQWLEAQCRRYDVSLDESSMPQ
jgi:hypothetical protein